MFIVDMADPAIDVRPLRQINGQCHFNEVFIDDLLVPDSHRIGEVDDGWHVAMAALSSERQSIGTRGGSAERLILDRLFDLARNRQEDLDDFSRQLLAHAYCSARVLELTNARLATSRDIVGTGAGSVGKLLKIRLLNRIMIAASAILGPAMVADTNQWGTYAWGNALLDTCGQRIAGGTDEIQRNTLGERVLGLPREPRENSTRSEH
jgi:acyl-CoA dehydrogenase